MRKIAPMIIIAILAIGAWLAMNSLGGESFESGYAKLNAIETKYSIGAEQLTPATEAELDSLETELNSFVAPLKDNSDGRALKLLASARLELIAMERGFIAAKKKLERMDKMHPDCSKSGTISQVLAIYDEATAKARLALEKIRIFLNNYSSQAGKTGLREEDFEYAVKGFIDSAEAAKSIAGSYCPARLQ